MFGVGSQELLLILIILFQYAVSIWVCVKMAKRKSREPFAWAVIGFLVSWLGVIILAFIPARAD